MLNYNILLLNHLVLEAFKGFTSLDLSLVKHLYLVDDLLFWSFGSCILYSRLQLLGACHLLLLLKGLFLKVDEWVDLFIMTSIVSGVIVVTIELKVVLF